MRFSSPLLALSALMLTTQFLGCGRDTGYLYEQAPVRHEEPRGQARLNSYNKLTWLFPCTTSKSPMEVPPASQDEFVFSGEGSHSLVRSKLDNTTVVIKGQICPPAESNRDMVMIFDASGSMRDNDPTKGQTCGRLQSFEAIMQKVNWKTTKVGALTFSDGIRRTSKSLFSSRDDLVKSLTNNGKDKLYKILCDENMGTQYDSALEEGERMLSSAREYASKEMFFITDGEPTDKHDAEERAKRLHDKGIFVNGKPQPVAIATIFLGKDTKASDYLRDAYASLDMNRQPIHANVQDADKLATTLEKMSGDNKLAGSNLTLGATGQGSQPQTIDLMPHINNLYFELPPFMLSASQFEGDYALKLEYWDSHMNRFLMNGKLILED